MKEKMVQIIENGSIGGCCGTTPKHIKKLNEIIKNKKPPAPYQVECDYIASRREFTKLSEALENNYESIVDINADPYDLMDISFSSAICLLSYWIFQI